MASQARPLNGALGDSARRADDAAADDGHDAAGHRYEHGVGRRKEGRGGSSTAHVAGSKRRKASRVVLELQDLSARYQAGDAAASLTPSGPGDAAGVAEDLESSIVPTAADEDLCVLRVCGSNESCRCRAARGAGRPPLELHAHCAHSRQQRRAWGSLHVRARLCVCVAWVGRYDVAEKLFLQPGDLLANWKGSLLLVELFHRYDRAGRVRRLVLRAQIARLLEHAGKVGTCALATISSASRER